MIPTSHMDANTLNDVLYLACAARGDIKKVYAHWTAGWYGQAYTDYHICIDADGKLYLMTDHFQDFKAHTWRRNSGAIGIALMCCAGAQANQGYNCNFGGAPPTLAQIDTLAQVTATLAKGLGLGITRQHFMTHAEAAVDDGYGPGSGDPETRWDLWYIPRPCGGLVLGGEEWRRLSKEYLEKLYL